VLGVREEIGYAVSSRHRNNLCECIFFSERIIFICSI